MKTTMITTLMALAVVALATTVFAGETEDSKDSNAGPFTHVVPGTPVDCVHQEKIKETLEACGEPSILKPATDIVELRDALKDLGTNDPVNFEILRSQLDLAYQLKSECYLSVIAHYLAELTACQCPCGEEPQSDDNSSGGTIDAQPIPGDLPAGMEDLL